MYSFIQMTHYYLSLIHPKLYHMYNNSTKVGPEWFDCFCHYLEKLGVCDLRYCVKVQRLELVGVLDTRQHHSSVYALLSPVSDLYR